MKLMSHWKSGLLLVMTLLVFVTRKYTNNHKISRKFETEVFLNKYLDVFSLRRKILRASNSRESINVGGVECELTDCLSKHLLSLPPFSLRTCSQNSDICNSFTCLDVLLGRNVSKWRDVFKSISKQDADLPDYLYHDLSCSEMIKIRGYVKTPLSNESREFPIAFNIIAHKSASQLENLLRSLYRPQNSYCIHVDSKSSPSFIKAVNEIIECFPNVFLASTLQRIVWGGYSRLQADITCMSDHLNRSHPFKYLINTAAQAFPIRTNEEIVKILTIYNGANDIEGIYGKRLLKSRYATIWQENTTLHTLHNTNKEKAPPPHNIDVVRGSAYGIFSRGFVEFIIEDQRAIDFLEWSETTWSPDELYWATLHHTYSNPHLKTPGGFSGYPMEKKWMAVYANWGTDPCRGKYVRGICVNGIEDLPDLIARKEFFVNKFHHDYQPLALHCLSMWIKFKESCDVPFNESFYRTLNFIKKPL